MPPEVIIVPLIFAIPAAVVYARMAFKHRERMASLRGGDASPDLAARLDRIEQAVESIAVEMERLGEGQRFVARVLSERGTERGAERADAVAAPGEARALAPGRLTTPH